MFEFSPRTRMTGLQNCYKRGADAEFLKKGPSLAFKREGWSPVLGPLLKSLHQLRVKREGGSSPPPPVPTGSPTAKYHHQNTPPRVASTIDARNTKSSPDNSCGNSVAWTLSVCRTCCVWPCRLTLPLPHGCVSGQSLGRDSPKWTQTWTGSWALHFVYWLLYWV